MPPSIERPLAPFTIRERVRWADVDFVQIMRFSAYPRLLELAEQEFLRQSGLPYTEVFDTPPVWLPRRRMEIDYLGPARLDDELEVAIWISKLGERSMSYRVDVRHAAGGAPIAEMTLAIVCVDVENFRPVPLPASWRTRAEAAVAQAAG
jgi:acyl-CoA thioester hydrolase